MIKTYKFVDLFIQKF